MTERKAGYVFTVAYAVGTDKNIQINGNFPLDASESEMTIELDKVFSACEKQRVKRLELPTARGALDDQIERLEEEKKALMELSVKPKLVGQESTQAKQHSETIRRLEEVIPKGMKFVADLEKKAA